MSDTPLSDILKSGSHTLDMRDLHALAEKEMEIHARNAAKVAEPLFHLFDAYLRARTQHWNLLHGGNSRGACAGSIRSIQHDGIWLEVIDPGQTPEEVLVGWAALGCPVRHFEEIRQQEERRRREREIRAQSERRKQEIRRQIDQLRQELKSI